MDGRNARSARTRDRITSAALELVQQGRTALHTRDIALHAKVSPRCVFQHFPDRRSLYGAMLRREERRVADLLAPIDPGLSLRERVLALVTQRDAVYHTTAALRELLYRDDLARTSASLAGAGERLRLALDHQVGRVLADELATMPDPHGARLRIEVITSFASWRHMATTQRLSRAARRQHMAVMLLRELSG